MFIKIIDTSSAITGGTYKILAVLKDPSLTDSVISGLSSGIIKGVAIQNVKRGTETGSIEIVFKVTGTLTATDLVSGLLLGGVGAVSSRVVLYQDFDIVIPLVAVGITAALIWYLVK